MTKRKQLLYKIQVLEWQKRSWCKTWERLHIPVCENWLCNRRASHIIVYCYIRLDYILLHYSVQFCIVWNHHETQLWFNELTRLLGSRQYLQKLQEQGVSKQDTNIIGMCLPADNCHIYSVNSLSHNKTSTAVSCLFQVCFRGISDVLF